MTTSVDLVASALDRWRNNLIDLTRRNPLLSLKPNHTTYLEIAQPELMKVYDYLLVQGKSWSFYFPPEKAKADKKNPPKEPPAPRATELKTSEDDRQVLLKILTNLYRRAWTDYRERGLHTLHLGLGVLEWRDEADEVIRSPIVLLPVKLERVSLKDPFQLSVADDDPIINPALTARLKQDFGFQMPMPPADWEEKNPDQYLAEVKAAISGLPGWDVQPSVVLTLFSFFKGVIFQDLQENAERLRAHPIVRTLAGEAGLLGKAVTIEERELDDKLDPREVYHILDADGSQRLCLEAAARGESFVLIGPPGTGKSQTIANLIADRIAHGKKVLFVSEKMAALEVVYKRLCNVGLGEFCLELHSAKANKREVIKELARCYQEKMAAQPQPSAADFALLKDRRDVLNRYVQALHQVREPMQKSVWEALAELPRWQDLPMIQIGLPTVRQAGDTTAKLTLAEFAPAHLDELKQLLQRLQHHWHIRTEANYPWRGFKADRYSLQLRDEIVSLIDRIRARDEKLRAAADQYAKQLGLRGSIADLLKLGDLLEKRPPNAQTSWLKVADLTALVADFEKCASQYARLGETRKPLTERYGPALWKLPAGSVSKIEQAWKAAAPLLTTGDERGAAFLKSQQKLRAWAAETQKRIPGWLTEVRTLEKWLALPLPVGAGSSVTGPASEMKLDPSVNGLRAFVRLATLAAGDAPPDKTWLEDRNVAAETQAVIAASKEAFVHYKKSRQYLLKLYDEKLFKLDLVRIGQAYAGWYGSWWCVFSWQYRKDRRAIAKTRPMEDLPATVAADMQLAGQVQTERIKLEADELRRSKLLGRYEKGLDTDIESAEKAVRHALEAHELLGHVDCERFPAKTMDALISSNTPEKIRAAVKRLNESFAGWTHLTEELQAVLPMTRLPGIGAAFDECSLSALIHYAKDLQTSLNQFAGLSDPVLPAPRASVAIDEGAPAIPTLARGAGAPVLPAPRASVGIDEGAPAIPTLARGAGASVLPAPRASVGIDEGAPAIPTLARGAGMPADMQSFIADLKQAEELLAWEASQATEAERWTKQLGPAFAGVSTDWDALRKAITWARLVRECVGRMQSEPRGLTPWLADAAPPSSRELRQALEPYEHALHSLEIRYDAPGPMLDGKPLRDNTPEVVLDLLTKWRDRVGELADWVDWRYLPERFAHLGLKSFWDHLQQHDVVREQVVDLFLKSFWSGWVDAMFQHDPVLSQYRRNEHEQLLKEFRELDRRILQQGAARITAILDPLQSKRGSDDPDVALLMREAHKKTKHLPLRQLFDAMPALLMQLKPCMLMSPLSVSQFLSADASKVPFDLIVFDEASQILPEDAVAAISRGKQLVITGDNQQLPPTTFFHQNADDGADEEDAPLFESILDACLGAGMSSKMLRWHYRSQHEHLIAFSNESFYDGRLVTFPSASFQSASLGVHFKHVSDGVYDRGGRRDNPREAQVVAQLVLDHYRQTPDQTLGVIAFSYAQMDAIVDEIERQLRNKPDLERFFKEDRLEGFFVKNLETVQGDERDVVLLSVGYGRDEQGKIELNFGPLNREGGERRLNVAVTRARQRLIVVSSIRGGDIKLGNSQAKGLAHLQRYLDFAEHGMTALQPDAAGTPPLTGLHEDVMRELKKLGFDSVVFVGCGPCRVDVGVRDPKEAGRFVLGIEFDGPMHAQAATARDRDRLRPEMLARLGWKLHHIGSPDWIFRKEAEIARLRQALI